VEGARTQLTGTRPRSVVRAALLLAALVLVACATVPGREGSLVHVTLLQINDVYTLEPVDDGRRGGMARLATLARAARRENPNTVFVLAGDALSPSVMSSFLKGEQMVAALNAIGLDLAVFGNHEFDFGPAVLARRVAESRFAWLASNVIDRRTGRVFGGARPSLLLTFDGIAVGFLGLTMPESAVTSSPGPDLVFGDPAVVGRAIAADLRAGGAKLVVAVTHQDMAHDKALAASDGVDVILGGHEHDPMMAEEGRALVTKAGSDGRYLVQVDLWLGRDGALVERSARFREVSPRVPPDPAVEALVRSYTARLEGELDVTIGATAVPLEARSSKVRTAETNLGDFIVDLVRARLGSDVALLNGGAIRTNRTVPAGPLTKRDVHGLLPFTTVIVKLEMPGARLRTALERGLGQADHEGGGFLQVSGLRLTWDPERPAGGRIVSVEVGDRPLAPDATYSVAIPSYLFHGGDGFAEFARARVLVDEESGPQLADLVLDAIARQGTIAPVEDGRLRRVSP
jgi:2',3'-cyclic-nucleotide 2'-phosphodiesterase (5'-nucleotidase family)